MRLYVGPSAPGFFLTMFPRVTPVFRVSVQHFFTGQKYPTAHTDRIPLPQSSAGGHRDCSCFSVFMNEAAFNTATRSLCGHMLSVFLGMCPSGTCGIAGSRDNPEFNFSRNRPTVFPQRLHHCTALWAMHGDAISPRPHQHLLCFFNSHYSHPGLSS